MNAALQHDDDALGALNSLDPNMSREEWVRVGFAARDAGITEEQWLTWCEGGASFDIVAARSAWKSAAKAGGVTRATLYKLAHDTGWRSNTPAAARAPRPVAPAPPEPVYVDPRPFWTAATPAPADHPYLARKRISAHGARVNRLGNLVVPYVDESGALQTIQAIGADGAKKFLKGSKAGGAVALCGVEHSDADLGLIVIAEGFATAATIFESAGLPCIAAGSRGQFPGAAKIARAWFPGARIVIAADVGDLTKAFECSKTVNADVCVPGGDGAVDGYDFNDWRADGADGAEISRRILQAALKPPASDAGAPDTPTHAPAPPDAAAAAKTPAKRKQARPTDFVTANGKAVPNILNVAKYLARGESGEFRFDTFTSQVLRDASPFDGAHLLDVTCDVQGFYDDGEFVFAKVGEQTVNRAVERVAMSRRFNSAADWLHTLAPWDATGRLGEFFSDVCGAADNEYTRAVGCYFWLSMVARMLRPGARADMSVVMIGGQGTGKTSLLRTIGGERYCAASFHKMGEADWCRRLRGMIVVEFSDFAGHSRGEIETIKATLSETHDTYREPYAVKVETFPRGNIFAGTTNESRFLTDQTGNRRWLPVQCSGDVNVEAVAGMREQYFAEALGILSNNPAFEYWNIPGASDEQDARVVVDPWQEILEGKPLPLIVQIDRLWSTHLQKRAGDVSLADRRRAGAVLRALGRVAVAWRDGGEKKYGFILSDDERVSGKSAGSNGFVSIGKPWPTDLDHESPL